MLSTNQPPRTEGFPFWGKVMLVHKGHRTQLLPNDRQQAAFRQWAGTHRWVWNWGLGRRVGAYRLSSKSPGAYTLMKEIVELKRTSEPWLRDASKSVPRVALLHLDDAYRRYFQEKKDGTIDKRIAKLKANGR